MHLGTNIFLVIYELLSLCNSIITIIKYCVNDLFKVVVKIIKYLLIA